MLRKNLMGTSQEHPCPDNRIPRTPFSGLMKGPEAVDFILAQFPEHREGELNNSLTSCLQMIAACFCGAIWASRGLGKAMSELSMFKSSREDQPQERAIGNNFSA